MTTKSEKNQVKESNGKRTLLFVALAVASGLCSSFIYERLVAKKNAALIAPASNPAPSTLVASAGYRYINPLVSCSGPVFETLPFKREIENYIVEG